MIVATFFMVAMSLCAEFERTGIYMLVKIANGIAPKQPVGAGSINDPEAAAMAEAINRSFRVHMKVSLSLHDMLLVN